MSYRKFSGGGYRVAHQFYAENEAQARLMIEEIYMGRPLGSRNKPKYPATARGGKVNAPEVDEDIFDEDDEDDEDDDEDDEPAPKAKAKPKAKSKPRPPVDDDDDDDDDDEDEDDMPPAKPHPKATTTTTVAAEKPLTNKALQKALQAMLDTLKAE